MAALVVLSLTPVASAIIDLQYVHRTYRILMPDQECDANGCYVWVCLDSQCYKLYLPTTVCLNTSGAPHSFTVGVGNPTRAGGCFFSTDITLP